MYTIKQINEIIGGSFFGSNDYSCSAYLTDSRQLTQPTGTIFFALVSSRNDAHSYIEDLVKRGVKSFVVSDQNAITDKLLKAKVSFVLVNDALVALQNLAIFHRENYNIPVIGITGSNGKTIVKEWLYQLLKDDQVICRSPKSYNSQIGVPLSVLNLNKQHTLAIFEAGISQPNEMDKLQRIILPSIGVFTSIGAAHDEGFKVPEQKLKEKLKLFAQSDTTIFNKYDSPSILFKQSDQLITIGQTPDCTIQLSYKIIKNRTQLNLVKGSKKLIFTIPFIDKASILNSCTCIAVMLHLNYEPKIIQSRIEKLQSIALRLEVKKGIHNSVLINDYYNSDLDSIKIALSFLNQQHRGEKKCLIVSDIEQSGRVESELYKELAVMVYQNKIDQLIGIGKAISNRASVFNPNSLFYADKDAFIKDLKNINSIFSNATILLKGAHSFKFDEISKHLQLKSHDTVLEINLNKLAHNVNHYRSLLEKNTQLMCMVKAMGYGSGSSDVAKTLQHIGVNYLAVAYADEGVELREANISLPIMVMSPERDSFEDLVKYNLEPEIYSFKMLNDFVSALDKMGVYEAFPIHLKFDTGMKRLGFEPEETDELINKLKSYTQVRVKSIFSHLVASDNTGLDAFTKQQINTFKEISSKIEKELGYTTIKHICNTGGISRFKQAHFDMVRLGIGMYGFGVNKKEQKQLENVSTLKTCISQIKRVKRKETVGYNRKGIAKTDMKIATIPIGYADGFHRVLGNGKHGVYIKGKFCRTVGNICMDMCMIDISKVKCEEGDEVIVFDNTQHIDQLAVAMNSIPYEVLTNISSRVKRIYTQE